jgi:hypothetical protein
MDGRVFSLSGPQNINEHDGTTSIKYFPNPVSEQLTIELNDLFQDDLAIRIFSIDGRLIINRLYSSFQQGRLTLDLSSLSTGLYILNVQGSEISKSYKLIKE